MRACSGRVEVTLGTDLHLRVATLLDERRQPADLQFATDGNQDIGLLQLQDEARLGFDEVGILIAACDRFHGDSIAADFRAIDARSSVVVMTFSLPWACAIDAMSDIADRHETCR